MKVHNRPSFNITPMAGSVPVPCCKSLQADTGERSSYKINFLPLLPKEPVPVFTASVK